MKVIGVIIHGPRNNPLLVVRQNKSPTFNEILQPFSPTKDKVVIQFFWFQFVPGKEPIPGGVGLLWCYSLLCSSWPTVDQPHRSEKLIWLEPTLIWLCHCCKGRELFCWSEDFLLFRSSLFLSSKSFANSLLFKNDFFVPFTSAIASSEFHTRRRFFQVKDAIHQRKGWFKLYHRIIRNNKLQELENHTSKVTKKSE